jgi:hypothetical protein
MRLRILLVDNHDSYTFNLFQLIAAVTGTEPDVVVVTNDGPLLARPGSAITRCASRSLPAALVATAWAEDGVIMVGATTLRSAGPLGGQRPRQEQPIRYRPIRSRNRVSITWPRMAGS